MFDMLTRDELCTLHTTLYQGATRAHHQLIDPDGRLVITPLTGDWDLYAAVHAELAEAMEAVDAELVRRDAERAAYWGMVNPKILAHDEGTSYCTSIPGKCPVHDA